MISYPGLTWKVSSNQSGQKGPTEQGLSAVALNCAAHASATASSREAGWVAVRTQYVRCQGPIGPRTRSRRPRVRCRKQINKPWRHILYCLLVWFRRPATCRLVMTDERTWIRTRCHDEPLAGNVWSMERINFTSQQHPGVLQYS
jgi:hypothetical protein